MNGLYEKAKRDFSTVTGSVNAVQVLDYLFCKPLFTQPDMQRCFGGSLSRQGTTNLLHKLEHAGIITQEAAAKGRTPAVWKFVELMNLLV